MLKHAYYRDIKVGSNLGGFYVDKDGYIDNISKELEELLLSINGYSKVEIEPEPEVVEEVEETLPDLHEMSVKELRAFAKEKEIKLSATKKADIIEEILAEM